MVMSFQMKMTAVLSGLLFTVTPIAVDANEDKPVSYTHLTLPTIA